jgi:hypothetical protein
MTVVRLAAVVAKAPTATNYNQARSMWLAWGYDGGYLRDER